ncbi:MAG: hypothetical protein Q9222_000826 [Ikaeria aurantiellina]
MAISQDVPHISNGQNGAATKKPLINEPLKLQGHLNKYKSFKVTPIIGTEFPDANLAEWLKAPNSDELIRDLAITISERGVVFFRKQTELTDELQKELAHRLGLLTGKPESSTLHIHPLTNFNADKDPNINIITTDKAANPAEDLWKNRPADIRNAWHTDAGYEPNPPDYSILKLVKLPEFLEGLTATFSQARLPVTAREKGFELYSKPRGSPNNVGDSLTTVHPVVRTNPVTGWKSLYGVGNHMQRINDVTPDESKRLHDYFLQMIVEEHDTQLRHRWQNAFDVGKYSIPSVLDCIEYLMDKKLAGTIGRYTIRLSLTLLAWALAQVIVRLGLAKNHTSTRTAKRVVKPLPEDELGLPLLLNFMIGNLESTIL